MGQFTKRPVTIEAMRFPGVLVEHTDEMVRLDEWLAKHQGDRKCRLVGGVLVIPTLEGEMMASAGDWIIRGVKGELYPCKPDIFEATYAPAAIGGSGLSFGEALDALKLGARVCRAGWNGKGMWLAMSGVLGGRRVDADKFWSPHNEAFARENGGSATVLPCITMKTATGEIVMGWLASQPDMLTDDWMVVSAA